MEIDGARALAEARLSEVDSLDEPLALAERPADVGWAWVFAYTTVRWLATGDVDAVPPPGGGPIVVVKASGETWMLGGARRYDDQLAEYARRHGHEHTIGYL